MYLRDRPLISLTTVESRGVNIKERICAAAATPLRQGLAEGQNITLNSTTVFMNASYGYLLCSPTPLSRLGSLITSFWEVHPCPCFFFLLDILQSLFRSLLPFTV